MLRTFLAPSTGIDWQLCLKLKIPVGICIRRIEEKRKGKRFFFVRTMGRRIRKVYFFMFDIVPRSDIWYNLYSCNLLLRLSSRESFLGSDTKSKPLFSDFFCELEILLNTRSSILDHSDKSNTRSTERRIQRKLPATPANNFKLTNKRKSKLKKFSSSRRIECAAFRTASQNKEKETKKRVISTSIENRKAFYPNFSLLIKNRAHVSFLCALYCFLMCKRKKKKTCKYAAVVRVDDVRRCCPRARPRHVFPPTR